MANGPNEKQRLGPCLVDMWAGLGSDAYPESMPPIKDKYGPYNSRCGPYLG